MLDKYEQLLCLFYQGDKWKNWPPGMVKGMLQRMDELGQLIIDRDEYLHGFVGWIWADEEQMAKMERMEAPTANSGTVCVPLFVAADSMRSLLKMKRELRKKVTHVSKWRKELFRRVF